MSHQFLTLFSTFCLHFCLATDEHRIEFIEPNFDDAWGFRLHHWTVSKVIKNSQAHKNGVREGFKVVELNGCRINEENEEVLSTLVDFQARMMITFRSPRQEMINVNLSESFLDESISNDKNKIERKNQEFTPPSSLNSQNEDEKFHFLTEKIKSFSSDGKTLNFENCLALIQKVNPDSTAAEHIEMVEDLLSQIWLFGVPTASQMVTLYMKLYENPDLRETIDCQLSLLGFEMPEEWKKKMPFKRKRIIGKPDSIPSSCDSDQKLKSELKECKINARIADVLEQIPMLRSSVENELFIYFYLSVSTDLSFAKYCQKVVEWKQINNPDSKHREYNYKNILCNKTLLHAEDWINKANQFLKEIRRQTSAMTVVRRMKYTRMLLYKLSWLEIKAQSFGLVFATEVGAHSVNAYQSWINNKDEGVLKIELDTVELIFTSRVSVDRGISYTAEMALQNIGDTGKIYLPELEDYQNEKKYRLEIFRNSVFKMNEVLSEKFKNQ